LGPQYRGFIKFSPKYREFIGFCSYWGFIGFIDTGGFIRFFVQYQGLSDFPLQFRGFIEGFLVENQINPRYVDRYKKNPINPRYSRENADEPPVLRPKLFVLPHVDLP